MNNDLISAYRHHRATMRSRAYGYRQPATAAEALQAAREDVENSKRRYAPEEAGAGNPFKIGSTEVRIIERYTDMGLRLVGFADEIAPRIVEHRGWYTRANDYCESELARGAVFLIPGKNGKARAVPGMVDPNNCDSAIIATRDMDEVDARGFYHGIDKSEFRDVAIWADNIAKSYAEDAREYDTAWQAGQRHAANMERIAQARKEARDIARAARDNVRNNPTICDVLRGKVRELRDEVRELCEENETLRAGDFERRDYSLIFHPSDELRAAFNDGACADVI